MYPAGKYCLTIVTLSAVSAACSENAYLVHVRARGKGVFEESLVKTLDSEVVANGFASLGSGERNPGSPGSTVSSFSKQMSADFRDRVEIYLIWEREPPEGPSVKIDILDVGRWNEPNRRTELDEMGTRFEQILTKASGTDHITVERKPISRFIF